VWVVVAVADSPDEPPPGLDQPQPDSIDDAGPGSPKRHWITQWQTIAVAIIAAIASIGVALISLVTPEDTGNRPEGAGNIVSKNITPLLLEPLQPHEVTISSVLVSAAPNGGRAFTVTGNQSIPHIDDGFIQIVGQPVNVPLVQGSHLWHASTPASLGSDGSWVAHLEIDSSEMRDIVIQAVFTIKPGISYNVPPPFYVAVSYPKLAGAPE